MLANERQQFILQLMQETRFVRISEIAQKLEVSNETARRDLEYLQKAGFLRRVHGGAKLVEHKTAPQDFFSGGQDEENAPDVLDTLAQQAAELVEDNDIIFLGQGTTMQKVARALKTRKNLTVLTNSLWNVLELIDTDVTVYCLGGILGRDERNMMGAIAVAAAQQFYASKTIISCGGISENGTVTDHQNDSTLHQVMLDHADKKILVAGSEKFGRNAFCKVCELSDFDTVITDLGLGSGFRTSIAQLKRELYIVGE